MEEVRYRRKIPVKLEKIIKMKASLAKQLRDCYPEESLPSEIMLEALKNHIKKQLDEGVGILQPMEKKKLEEATRLEQMRSRL